MPKAQLAFTLTLLAGLLALPVKAQPACRDVLPKPFAGKPASRAITAQDLIELRDLGNAAPQETDANILSISGDGQHVAFIERKADIATNSYCLAVIVTGVVPNATPMIIDQGGEPILQTVSYYGFADFTPAGGMLSQAPAWSPDDKQLAYLRRDHDSTQVWLAAANGSGARQVTRFSVDAEAVAWAPDGKRLVFRARPALRTAEAAISAEASKGYLYDTRFISETGFTPRPTEPIAEEAFTVDPRNGEVAPATDAEAALVGARPDPVHPAAAGQFVEGAGGAIAWVARDNAENIQAPSFLHVRDAKGSELRCDATACRNIQDMWWSPDGSELIFLQGSILHEPLSLYTWRPGRAAPAKVLSTEDALVGCKVDVDRLICGRETSAAPRDLISIDWRTGVTTELFNPNPEFATVRLGTVRRLRWTNSFGLDAFADLVLPPDHKPGQRHPLIVVGYDSEGFLRGGTGDEYPIFLLAAKGYAVFSFQRPKIVAWNMPAKSGFDMMRMMRKDWLDWKNNLDALNRGVDLAIQGGAVDPDKIALTGFSNGATNAAYDLLHSRRFKAAIVSHCCEDFNEVFLDGPAATHAHLAMGNPKLTDPDRDAQWADLSFVVGGRNLHTPLLIEEPDREAEEALQGFAALKELGKPVEMYVFPDEYHVKIQPIHRAAIYARNLDWFDFWLLGTEDPDPAKADQYARWRQMKAESIQDASASPGH